MGDIEQPIDSKDELHKLTETLPAAISLFNPLSQENRQKLLQSLATIFSINNVTAATYRSPVESILTPSDTARRSHFSEDRSISPKDFMLQKLPRTDVERVACLAYYLTHYRETPYFKTLDISKLNTDAAQMKFSNAAKSVDNATLMGYLAPGTKGTKQLSAAGELFVRAMPDRDMARSAMASARPRRRSKRAAKEQPEDGNIT